MKRIIVVIPARMASSRYPGKPLAEILGLPMVEHIRRRALLAKEIDEAIVATCDKAIMDVVTQAGGRAVMTADTHERATERVAEAVRSLEGDIVIVVQGDEPLLMPDVLEMVAAPFLKSDGPNCVSLLSHLESEEDYNNPNIVKAACDQRGNVLFFSRAPIPYFQHSNSCPIYRETGIRAFRKEFLRAYVTLPETPFEQAESVGMLRLLEHGYRIFGVVTQQPTLGVDHPEDIVKVEQILTQDPIQRALYRQIAD